MMASGVTLAAAGVGTFYWPNRWNHIVIHHSAGGFATIEFLQDVHRDRQSGDPIDAIPYHFVIGNGNGLGMGEIASDWRWHYNIWGTHVSANNPVKNFSGIGICMVGNFDTADVPAAQFQALVSLTRSLMRDYGILPANVGFHGRIDGESTRCPGSRFPYDELRKAIT